jgi:hypothetical protein
MSTSRIDCPDFLLKPFHFINELITQLREIRPDLVWSVFPDQEPMTVRDDVFFVCCRSSQKPGDRFALFSAVRCETQDYHEATDQRKWVADIAAEAASRLPTEFARSSQ